MPTHEMNWAAIEATDDFRTLHRKKSRFLWGLMLFSVFYYFLLPVGAGYFPGLFKIKVWGVVNIGILFALSEFIVAWGIAWIYSHKANTEFDAMTQKIVANAQQEKKQ